MKTRVDIEDLRAVREGLRGIVALASLRDLGGIEAIRPRLGKLEDKARAVLATAEAMGGIL